MKLVYPIILYPMEEHEGGYTVEVPDLPGCVTEGHDLADALDMARDAASGWILDEMEDGRAVPHASNITDVKPDEPDGIVSLISLDMDAYAEKYGSKAVRKNVTIPAWLDTFGERNNINYSQVLREGLEAATAPCRMPDCHTPKAPALTLASAGAFVCSPYAVSSMISASMMSVSSWRSGMAWSSRAASDAVSLWV